MFNLLESACSEMAKVSQKLKHQSTSKKVYSDILRSKMMWGKFLGNERFIVQYYFGECRRKHNN